MCNEVRRRIALGQLREDWGQTRIPLVFPEGAPNMAPLESIRITDPAVIIRAAGGPDQAEAVTRRWSWPGTHGKPVYNFRSDGREFRSGRCLIPVDGFFEFTAPADPKQKRKDKWLFTLADHDWFCIAGLWRSDPAVGEAFTLLTCPPGLDTAPYHSRQMVVLGRDAWASWLDPAVPAAQLCQPLPAGSLQVSRV
ncbi:SOS response-associated peptidase [Sphingomonas sp. ID1715]|uniref:SOS response-associated peptidase family protein n=1 Tax=Sphingomonas sp. ID1715 TaxID=1656898 RepID=UPI0014894354|nr:SOS response-associated peptidase [Sphingomonas sp. ID1715]NNM78351.1 SOS response-associated peptidase [Sphingomonas sp. ID1715]